MTDQTISLTPALEQQAQTAARLNLQLRELLRRGQPGLPASLGDDASHLSNGLTALRKQAAALEARHANLLQLIEINQVLNSSLTPADVLRVVMDTMVRLLNAERGFLMLRNEQGELTIQIARNWEQESVNPSEFAISSTIVHQVIREGRPVLTTNAQQDPRFGGQESVVAYNLRSILCVPLKVKDELTGVLYADNRIRAGIFTETELELLTALGDQAAVAIENARLFDSLRRTLVEVTALKNLLDNVFASLASGVITTDTDEIITLCNQAAETILGYPRGELIHLPLGAVVPAARQALERLQSGVLTSGRGAVSLEVEQEMERRGRVSLSLNAAPLKDGEQNVRGIALVLDDVTEKKHLQAQRRLFERMVAPAVIEQLDPDQLQLGGKRSQITTLFADIRGFTSFSERMSPEQLVSILNRYLAAAAEAVLNQQGTIDKFLGDAIMAWFNAPIPQPDHALRAVRAALEMGAAVRRLNAELPPEHRLAFGAGIHFGEAVLGLVGAEKRLDYTAIGDSVNTAKRIQENAAAGQVLISAAAHALVAGQVQVIPAGALRLKGKSEAVIVYEVVGAG